ncbi:uncharacterized protein [Periplaneta americana]|uniref:uncharacterized protein n=1 Tax=Periplaneta americana TaxID=6978 RepID=UPI0037E82976
MADVVLGFAYRCHPSGGASQIQQVEGISTVDYGKLGSLAPWDRWCLGIWGQVWSRCLICGATWAEDETAILEAQNHLHSQVALGGEMRSNLGPQTLSANMQELVFGGIVME